MIDLNKSTKARQNIMHPLNLYGNRTLVMGILNITPDSFSDGGKYLDYPQAVEHALKMVEEGADIIDMGGESSRPGALPVSESEELKRIIPVLKSLRDKTKVPISVDTTKSIVAREVLNAGATMINDITALQGDSKMVEIITESKCPIILMHMQGTPRTMQENPYYENVILDIKRFFSNVVDKAISLGVQSHQIILDPGIGFGKTIEHNLTILHNLSEFEELGYPLLIGVSRKSFIGKILDLPVDQRLEGSLAAAAIAIWNGAKIVRVHDVSETVRMTRIVDELKKVDT